MKDHVIKILTELRPEFDFSQEGINFIEEGMLDSFDIVSLVDALDTEFNIVIDGTDIIPESLAACHSFSGTRYWFYRLYNPAHLSFVFKDGR